MRSACVVERQIPPQAFTRSRYAVIGAQVDLLVFDRPPKPFNEHTVPPRSFSVHTDLDVGLLRGLNEVDGCELTALDALLSVKRRFALD